MVLGWCWDGAGMVLGWCWDGAGMVLGWCWDGAGMVPLILLSQRLRQTLLSPQTHVVEPMLV